MLNLSERQTKSYKRIKKLVRIYSGAERSIIEELIEVEDCKLHKALGFNSLYKFATKELKLTDPTALMLIGVSRAAKTFPDLRCALAEQKISPPKASRIIAHLTPENAREVVNYAIEHTFREVDHEMARRNPDLSVHDSAKPISEDTMLIKSKLSKSAYAKLERVQSLEAQKGKDYASGAAIEAALDEYLYRHDPIEKAKRSKLCADRVENGRPSEMKRNAALARDGGRCTYRDKNGERCDCDRWVEVHHIIKLSEGGTNDLENLTTLGEISVHAEVISQSGFAYHS